MIKRILGIAAGIVVAAGVSLGIALSRAMEQERIECKEWIIESQKYMDEQKWLTFFVSMAEDAKIPEAIKDYAIGLCVDGECVIGPEKCPAKISYYYEQGKPFDGQIMLQIKAPVDFAEAWKALPQDQFKWLGTYADTLETAKAEGYDAASTMKYIDADSKCFLLKDGSLCRYGRLCAKGIGCDRPCPPFDQFTQLYPCVVLGGGVEEEAARTLEQAKADAR